MSPRRVISFSGRLFRLAVYIITAAVVIFFALTRTEVGREGLRNEMERQFNRSLRGSLEIGHMSGNVLNRLSARDVVVRDSIGREIISVDSVVLHPTWTDVLRRTLSTGRITLIRPQLLLHRDERGRWSVQSALERTKDVLASEPWAFRSTRVEIVDGRVLTRSEGALPSSIRDGRVFDWTNAEVVDLNGRALVDWEPRLRMIDVLELSGRIEDADLNIAVLRGQLVLDDGGLALNEVHLRTASSALHVNGSISSLEVLRSMPETADIQLDLGSSTIDGAELGRLFPHVVIDGAVTAAARVQGPVNHLAVADLSARRGSSELSLEGMLRGLPDSVYYDAAIRSASIFWRDLQAVWPDPPIPSFEHLGAVDLSGRMQGTLRPGGPAPELRWEGTNELLIQSAAGRLDGVAHLAIGGVRSVVVEGMVDLASFDAGRLLNQSDLPSDLNGRVELKAEGPSLRDVAGQAAVALTRSTWTARSFDSLRVELTGSLSSLQGDLYATDGTGDLTARISADLASAVPSYRFEGRTLNLDLGPLLRSDSLSSSLNANFLVDGRGRSWTAFEGDMTYAFDSSRVSFGSRIHHIPAHASRLVVRQAGAAAPRLVLSGDIADVEVAGDVSLHALAILARHWHAEFARSVATERAKPYRLAAAGGTSPAQVEPTADRLFTEAPDVSVLSHVGEQSVQLSLHMRRSDILSAFFPTLPALHTDLRANGRLTMNPTRFDVELQATADSLEVDGIRSKELNAGLTAAAGLRPSVSRSLAADVSATASTLQIGDQTLSASSIAANYYDRGFDLALDASSPAAAAPLRFRARMDLLQDRNRLVIHDFQAPLGDQLWIAPDVNIVDFFEEAVYVRGIRIERAAAAQRGSTEYLQIAGTLSSAAEDTLFVRAEDLLMQHVGRMIGAGNDLGGRLDGRLAFTGLNRRPELTGRVDIQPLSYRDRHLGRLSISSRYIPGSPNVGLSVALSPTLPEDSMLRTERNNLSMNGTFRLPRFGSAFDAQDAGALDLEVRAERADAFFFDYLFRDLVADVTGYLEGSGHIGGDFDAPIFDADLTVRDGRFRIPEFGLSYGVAGPVTVDRRGIHLGELRLTDAENGRAVVGGSILFNDYRFFSFDLRGELDDVLIMNVQQSRDLPFYGRIMASGDVSLTGPLSNAQLTSSNARTSPDSDLYIPISETSSTTDAGFIVFADSTGRIPDFQRLMQRQNLLDRRPEGERPFLDGLGMDLDLMAPNGSTVHLVIDPLLGDVINAVGSGRIQLVRDEGDFSTFGTFTVSSGDYLFTAGEVFFRRFLIDSGSITWDGDPLDAMLDISASYRTRASTEGLGLSNQEQRLIPLVIELDVTGRVTTPIVDLALSIDRAERTFIGGYEGLEALLNQPEYAAQYATSVLLTNSFLLTADQPLSQSRGQLAFNSLSQLVASQLNRYINYALPNVNLNLGVQGESAQDLDVTYGVALRMLDERLIIRGQGIYQTDELRRQEQTFLDEFVVEVRLNPRVSVEVFYRREGDILNTESLNTSTTGAGLSYQTEFSTWRRLVDRLFGWIYRDSGTAEPGEDVVAGAGE